MLCVCVCVCVFITKAVPGNSIIIYFFYLWLKILSSINETRNERMTVRIEYFMKMPGNLGYVCVFCFSFFLSGALNEKSFYRG